MARENNWMSPHCQSGNCAYCAERRRRKREAATRALQALADARPGMFFWDSKIERGTKNDLGPSSPDAWKQTYVKGKDPRDIFGFWER